MRIEFATASQTDPSPSDRHSTLRISTPHLGGPSESIPPSARRISDHDNGSFEYDNGMTLYAVQLQVRPDTICDVARDYFRDIFSNLAGKSLYRIWNYIPDINAGEGDSEVYRRFCLGRSRAYEESFSAGTERFMAAGSCVGCSGDVMTILALAGKEQPEHFENPNQVPAYRYPREYGPKAPSFARASNVRIGDARYRFISGTAAVLGHQSIGVDDLVRQLEVTGDNLETIVAETETDSDQIASTAVTGKVYLRHAEDFATARDYLVKRFPNWCDKLIYLKSDICRQELLLEVELTFLDSIAP